MKVRTRFAPSPTGYLHIGGVRTALYSWLYARHHQGEFILRIEDTDRARSSDESIQAILGGMDWLGLNYDGELYYQTNHYDRYNEVINDLIASGHAYRCKCSEERLNKMREEQLKNKKKPHYDLTCRDLNISEDDKPYVVRFKNPLDGEVTFEDQVYGSITVKNSELDDLIIKRSDGNPTYNLTVIVDDMDMEITHVIRGDDHINNTPRQINLLRALGVDIPVYAHLPMILGEDGKRLSKRHGAVSILQFKERGILPPALLNYLVRLGWSHGDQEIFSMEEMINYFDFSSVSKSGSAFDNEKLLWLNHHYLQNSSTQELVADLKSQFESQNINIENGPALKDLIAVQGSRCKTLVEMVEVSEYFYQDTIEFNEKAQQKHLKPTIFEPLSSIKKRLLELDTWTKESLHQVIIDTAAEFELKLGKIAQPIRVAITGNTISPSIDDTLLLCGKERALERLTNALEIVQKKL